MCILFPSAVWQHRPRLAFIHYRIYFLLVSFLWLLLSHLAGGLSINLTSNGAQQSTSKNLSVSIICRLRLMHKTKCCHHRQFRNNSMCDLNTIFGLTPKRYTFLWVRCSTHVNTSVSDHKGGLIKP